MFSYGSGLTSTMFSFKINEGQHPFSLLNIADIMNVSEKLEARHVVSTATSFVNFFTYYPNPCCSTQMDMSKLLGTLIILLHWPHLHEWGIFDMNPLKSSMQVPPEKFVEALKLMEHRYRAKDFVTSQDTSLLASGTYCPIWFTVLSG
jgi:hypothetical protein